jgi:DNA polymerase-3 subunit gamma/tau
MGTKVLPLSQDPYLVFARKYRPQHFDEVVGQTHITQTLKNALLAGRVAHAFLFSGARGVGKTTVARILAKALNCDLGPTADPCNQCAACVSVSEGRALDVLEVDGASHRGINEIKDIIENLRYQPIHARFRIAIIDEVHQLTDAAFNALLKTLEEPPPHVKFIFATTDVHKVPDTVRSRCQCFFFRRIRSSEISELIGRIAKGEGMELSQGALQVLARSADGSLRDAQSLLDQIRIGVGNRIDETMARDLLGAIDPGVLLSICAAAIARDTGEGLRLVNASLQEGFDVLSLIRGLAEQFRCLLICSVMADPAEILGLSIEEVKGLKKEARKGKAEEWYECVKTMLDVDQAARYSVNSRILLEMGLVRICSLPQWAPLDDLLTKITDMENRLIKEKDQGSNLRDPAGLPARVSSPKAESAVAERDQAQGNGSPMETDRWAAFVSFLQAERAFLASRLERVQLLDFREGYIEIGDTPGHYLDYLRDPENFSLLLASASRFFEKDVKLVVKEVPQPKTSVQQNKESVANDLGQHEMLQEALRIFGGSVREVRSVAGKGKGDR